jgi:A/G-specific adenine glycosylase
LGPDSVFRIRTKSPLFVEKSDLMRDDGIEVRRDVPRFRRTLSRWGAKNRRTFPWRETDDPFRILIAEVLLQRSRGITVAKVYERLFERWPDAEHLARARVDSITSVIRPLGLTSRAMKLRDLARAIVELGAVPDSPDGLLALPGVGRYAAGATLAVAFNRYSAVVDGVTARVYRRYFGLVADLPAVADKELWSIVSDITPKRSVREWNWAVLDLAATICLPKVPRCSNCPLRRGCAWAGASVRAR